MPAMNTVDILSPEQTRQLLDWHEADDDIYLPDAWLHESGSLFAIEHDYAAPWLDGHHYAPFCPCGKRAMWDDGDEPVGIPGCWYCGCGGYRNGEVWEDVGEAA